MSLGPYRQIQIVQFSYDDFFGMLYREFVGDLGLLHRHMQGEYFKMKCCSLKPKNIYRHIKRMSERFYVLNGINDPSLKRVFFASFPEELQHDMERLIQSTNRNFDTFGLGELSHIVQEALKIMCEKQAATERFFKQRKTLKQVCKTNLEIGYKKHDVRDCKPSRFLKKKKNKFSSNVVLKTPFVKRSARRHRNIRFFRKKFKRARNKDRCYLCKKPGHFARNCPTKKEKSTKMNSQLMINHPNYDIESLYFEQSQADENTFFAMEESHVKSSSDSDNSCYSHIPIFMSQNTDDLFPPMQMVKASPQPVLFTEVDQPPHIQVTLLTSRFAKPLKVIDLIDIGAAKTMVNPDLFLADFWIPSKERFQTANREIFKATISRHKLGIKFFPDYLVWIHVYRIKLHGRDILIVWGCYCKAQQLRILLKGLRYKGYFQPYSLITHMYAISDAPVCFEHITNKLKFLCADSHITFQHPSPLWKNEEFFVKLLFKFNENINLTKATHPSITPDD
jgi:hypothetical protein